VKPIAAAAAGAATLVVGVLLLATALAPPPSTPSGVVEAGQAQPSAFALRDIPPRYLADYEAAGAAYHLDWTILAGIGKVESDHGRLRAPGVTSGVNSFGCCAGPMQISLTGHPSTWDTYHVDGNHDGQLDVYDPDDAIPTAAHLLLSSGAPADYHRAILAYNHSDAYVADVLGWAGRYTGPATAGATGTAGASGITIPGASPKAAVAIRVALSYLGTPYHWGGNSPATGFDCSGLVQYAYAQAGVRLPRTTYQQWNAGPHVPAGQLQPGDIVFFENLGHEGLYIGNQRYVEAPHTGDVVKTVSLHTGDGYYVGAVRPGSG
jgi:cell wall-associated NlpC family hydrolase